MTFASAKKKLKKIADGKYHQISYESVEYHTGKMRNECIIYVDDCGSHSGPTWDDAFRQLDIEMNPPKVDVSEQPKGQA